MILVYIQLLGQSEPYSTYELPYTGDNRILSSADDNHEEENKNINNILIVTIVSWGNKEITSNWISWMIKNGYKDNLLLILTDTTAYKYWSIHTNNSLQTEQVILYQPMASLNMTTYIPYKPDTLSNFKKFTCYRPFILHDLLFDDQLLKYWKNHKSITFESVFYIDTDAIFLKSKHLLEEYLFNLYHKTLNNDTYLAFGEGGLIPNKTHEKRLFPEIKNETNATKKMEIYHKVCNKKVLCTGLIYFHFMRKWSNYKQDRIKQLLLDWGSTCDKLDKVDQEAINLLFDYANFTNYGPSFRNKHVYVFDCNLFPNGVKNQRGSWLDTFWIGNTTWIPYLFHANGKAGKDVKIDFFKEMKLWSPLKE